jgi:LysM repeat protein
LQKKGKNMDNKKSTRSVIDNYRKRRQQNQIFIVWGGAALLILIGLILLVIWLTGPSKPLDALFATETPTPTMTYTPTLTSTPTETPTVTITSTVTSTPTPSQPFNYTVQEGDYLALIIEKYNLGDNGLALIRMLNPYQGINPDTGLPIGIDDNNNIVPGMIILLPNPGMPLPTSTPLPTDLARGTKLTYTVQAGDTLAGIASIFNSTVDDIITENNLNDPNAIFAGQQLVIPVNIVTATATRPPTSTPITPGPGTELPTATLTPIN